MGVICYQSMGVIYFSVGLLLAHISHLSRLFIYSFIYSFIYFRLRETFEYVEDTGRTIIDSKLLPLDLIPDDIVIAHVYGLWEVILSLNEEMHKT